MICQEVMELMQRYIDGDLDQQETSLMMDHVGQCPDCAAMLDRLQRLSSELEQLPRVMPRYSLVDAILPELERLHAESVRATEEEASDSKPTLSRSRRPGRGFLTKVGGVIAAGIAVGFLLFSQDGSWPFSGGTANKDASSANELLGASKSAQLDADPGALNYMIEGSAEMESPAAQNDDNGASGSGAGGSEQSVEPQAPQAEPSSAPAQEKTERGGTDKVIGTQEVTVTSGGGESGQAAPPPDVESNSDVRSKAGFLATEDSAVSDQAADALGDQPMALRAMPAAIAFVSPDGQWRAVAVEGTGVLQVYQISDDSLLYESEPREGSLSELMWNPESTALTFVWTDTSGAATNMAFDVAGNKEITR